MLKRIMVFICLLVISQQISAQGMIDLSKIKSHNDLKAMRAKLGMGNGTSNDKSNYLDSASWHGVKLERVALRENTITVNIGAYDLGATKRLVHTLQQQYKSEVQMDANWSGRKYKVSNSEFDILLSMDVDKEEEVKDNTYSDFEITFRPFYDAAYPNIGRSVTKNPAGIFYRVSLDYFGSNVAVFVNGVSVFNGLARARNMNDDVVELNPFILEKGKTEVKVLITPGLDEDGKPYPTIQKRSHVTAVLEKGLIENGAFQELSSQKICDYNEYVTDTIVENGRTRYSSYPGTYKYGGKQLLDVTVFSAEVDYQNIGWKNGNDLRSDKQLKEKVAALYQKLATVIRNKDGAALSDMFLQMGKEQAASDYGQKPGVFSDNWELWMMAMDNANVLKVETDFDIEVSEDGKLIYAMPNKLQDMLRAIGKETATGFTHYMYEDKTTNELKFIR